MAKRSSSLSLLLTILFTFVAITTAHAGGTAEEAEAIVHKALAYVKTNGVDKAVELFNQKESEYVKGDLYVFMFRVSETPGARVVTLAHPANPGLVGKDLYELKDPNGYQFMAAMAKKAMEDQGGWVDYKWSNPITRKIGEKSSFVLPAGPDMFVGCGIYK